MGKTWKDQWKYNRKTDNNNKKPKPEVKGRNKKPKKELLDNEDFVFGL